MPTDDQFEMLSFIVDHVEVGLFAVDQDFRITLWNGFMAMHSGMTAEEVKGRNLFECFPELPSKWLEKKIQNVFLLKNYAFTSWEQRPHLFKFPHNRSVTGGMESMRQNCTFLPVKQGEAVDHVCVALFDYTETALFQKQLTTTIAALEVEKGEQRKLIAQLAEAQGQLLQAEKMASIGQLAAGVAHEINNPVGFVNGNFGSLEGYISDLMRLLSEYEGLEALLDQHPQALARVNALKKEIEIDFLREDVPQLFKESRDGLDRVKRIVQDLKDFSRVDQAEWQSANLHDCLNSTLSIVQNEVKYKAEVIKNYGALPLVECMPSQLNQVFLNLLVNAAQAIKEHGRITIRTAVESDWVLVSVSDTGSGIPPDVVKRIFDPFFTTKPVGTGTGLGLSVSYSIVNRHGGRIEVDTQVGAGTTFSVWLPIVQTADAVDKIS
ncbi:ATP-binding protein [Aquabacterium sp.]|uniref:ATP-binding protein n=1 Tax=Aquabacterium sp. TaxID=1872578 RepID=UPI002488CC7E|nr:ATP-binding protein [Aquabacterium sp.]MDI1260006.1 ATP-binding protein [Aquabacterium sp.]